MRTNYNQMRDTERFLRRKIIVLIALVLLATVSIVWLIVGRYQPVDICFPPIYGSACLFLDEMETDAEGFPLNFLLISKNCGGLSDFLMEAANNDISFHNEKIIASISNFEKDQSAGNYTLLSLTVRLRLKEAKPGEQIRLEQMTLGGREFDFGELTLYLYATREHPPELSVSSESVATTGAGLAPYQAGFLTGSDSFFITDITVIGYEDIMPTLSFQEEHIPFIGTAVEIPPNVKLNLQIDFSWNTTPDAEVYYAAPNIKIQSKAGRESTVRFNCFTCGLFLSETEILNLGNRMFQE